MNLNRLLIYCISYFEIGYIIHAVSQNEFSVLFSIVVAIVISAILSLYAYSTGARDTLAEQTTASFNIINESIDLGRDILIHDLVKDATRVDGEFIVNLGDKEHILNLFKNKEIRDEVEKGGFS